MKTLVFALIFQCFTPLIAQKRVMEFQNLSNLLNESFDLNGATFCVSNAFNDINFKRQDVINLFKSSFLEKKMYHSSRKIRFKNGNRDVNCNCLNDSIENWISVVKYNDSLYSDFLEKYLMKTNEILDEVNYSNFLEVLNEAIRDSSIQFVETTYFIVDIKSLQKISRSRYYVRLSITSLGRIGRKSFSDVLIGCSKDILNVLDIRTY